ncbi:SecDF P1 head subdomain-containing protein [Streptomyces sp. SAJ15]|uniref:SecDF P1 head subdomain-containing protein n=1 Tax=Streptomyces sp. SAJ15 TaxID=2011095 RepID=UPI00118589BE|nr:hypothetical protein [Streptomyces sp. SAJ15]TVL90168.1 hypothetical protein CD790_23850 [Streptomyces sp. SAJ15]
MRTRIGAAAIPVALLLAGAALTGCEDDEGGGEPSAPLPGDRASATSRPADRPSGDPSGASTPRPVRGAPLRFLPVEREAPGACRGASPTSFTERSDTAGTSCLTVTPRESDGMTITGTAAAKASFDEYGSGWIVTVTLTDTDARRFGELSERLATRTPPTNRVAMIRDGRLLSAPAVTTAITGGKVQISGSFTQDTARRLAEDLGG